MRQAGSVVKKRNRWYVVYRTAAGKQKWEGSFETKGEGQTRLTEILGQIQTGSYIEPTEMLFKEFADQWLKNRVNIEGATTEGYASYLRRHINPVLGEMKLKEIRHCHVQEMVATLTKKENKQGERLAASSIDKIVKMLHALFRSAVKNESIRINPANDLEMPKIVKKLIKPPSKKDVLAILKKLLQSIRSFFSWIQ